MIQNSAGPRNNNDRLTTSNSGFVDACPRLTELTVTSNPYATTTTKAGVQHDPAGMALSAISELVVACEGLPDFDTLQILHAPAVPPYPVCWCGLRRCNKRPLHAKQWEQSRREQTGRMKDFAIDCLKTLKSGRLEGGGRKRTVVRVVRLSLTHPHPEYSPGSVGVEEYVV